MPKGTATPYLDGKQAFAEHKELPPRNETSPAGLDEDSRGTQGLNSNAFQQRHLSGAEEDFGLSEGKLLLLKRKQTRISIKSKG